MPLYEYVCEEDGTVVEVMRPMSEADQPLPDPENRGRTFVRKHSTFLAGKASREVPIGQSCGRCGRPGGSCAMG